MPLLTGRVVALPLLLVGLLGSSVLAVRPADAAAPTGFSQSTVVSGLANPTAMAFAPDGRLFVATQAGSLRVVKDGVLLSTPFLTVPVSSSGERGLLGVAFDPSFASNGYVYVYYTATTPAIHNRVSRFTAAGDVAVAGSETVILDLNNLTTATNHNGGALHVGPDGKLYVAVGDNATGSNSQSLSNLLGKILRVDLDGSIPTDNPFHATATGVNRAIWALGLRNPYTFAFRPGSSRMFINDVGQNAWEEIDDGSAGSNYGWPSSEGPTTTAGHTGPLYHYGHGTGPYLGCAITGGTFYDPAVRTFPASYVGSYFFADYCGGWINRLDPSNGNAVTTFATGIAAPVDLRVGPDGALYYLARGSGSTTGVVGRIAYTASGAPTILQHPGSRTVPVGTPVTFSVSALGSEPLAYRWQRDGVDIAGASASTYTLASPGLADSGARFRVVVTNAEGSVTSGDATLTVVTNTAPVASISSPSVAASYAGGDVIAFAGSATDAQETPTPQQFSWSIVLHHDTHTHPYLELSSMTSGTFTVPRTGEVSTGVWYVVSLTVTDSGGLTHTVGRRIDPRTVSITLSTTPSGLSTTVDGQPCAAPCSFRSVVGMERSIGAPSPQTLSGTAYAFSAWSDRGRATHTIITPSTATTYTATYKAQKRR